MLDKKTVYNGLEMLCINFSIGKTEEELKSFCRVVYPILNKNSIDNDEFINAIGGFMEKTTGSNFNKLPSVGDFLKMLGKTPKSVEQLAKEQCMLVWEGGYTYAEKLMFDNPTTNYVIENGFNGLSNFRWKYLNSENENRIGDNWGQKDFIEKWITAYESGKENNEPLRSDACNSQSTLTMIGDKNKINMMLEFKPNNNNKTSDIIKKLSNSKKI